MKQDEDVGIHSRPDCPFNYCDQEAPFTACKDRCRHSRESQGSSEEAAFRKAMSTPPEIWYPCGCKASAGAPKYCPEHGCPTCQQIKKEGGFGPSHNGSTMCESGSIASGGKVAHCTCDMCF